METGGIASALARGPSGATYHIESRSPVTDGSAYAEHSLVSVDPRGAVRWKAQLPGDAIDGSTIGNLAVGADESITLPAIRRLSTDTLTLWRYSAAGELIWTQDVGRGFFEGAGGALERDGTYYINSGQLIAIAPDGRPKWIEQRGYPANPKVGDYYSHSAPSIGKDGTIFVTDHPGGVIALDRDGRRKWAWPFPYPSGDAKAPIPDEDGTVYLVRGDSTLYAVKDGKLKWTANSSTIGKTPYFFGDPVIDSSGILRLATDSLAYSFTRSGEFLTRQTLPKEWGNIFRRRAPSIDSARRIVSIRNHMLIWLDPDGLGGYLEAPLAKNNSEPLLDDGSVIYIGLPDIDDRYRILVSVKAPVERVAKAPWPMWNRDERNTRNGGADW